MSEATTTITAPLGSTFSHSAWVEGDTPGSYDVEVGPRLTFRRVLAGQVKKGDHLMDAFGRPSIEVTGVRKSTRSVSLTFGDDRQARQSFGLVEVLNVFVSSEDVPQTT